MPSPFRNPPRNLRLGQKIVGVLVLVLTTCSLAYLAVFSVAYHQKLEADLTRDAMSTASIMAAAIRPQLPSTDRAGLNGLLSSFIVNEDIVAVSLVDAKGTVFESSNSALIGQKLDVPELPQTDQQIPAVSTTDTHGNRVLRAVHQMTGMAQGNGALVLDYQASRLTRDTWQGAGLMALAGGTVLLGALAAISAVLQRTVLRPVHQLNAAANRFAEGDFSTRAHLQARDEIGNLGQRFDSMAGRIGTMVESLRRNEDFLQRVIDAVPDGIRVISQDYQILKVNRAYCQQLGLTPEQAVGQKCFASSHQLEAPCSASLVTCPLVELGRGPKTELKCQHRHMRRDGSILFAEVSAGVAKFIDNGIEKDCVIESIRDLGEQAQISHQYRLAEMGQLATGIAHEIHNPLWSIHLALDAIKQEITASTENTSFATYLSTAHEEINRCLQVTDRLLILGEPPREDITIANLHETIAAVTRLVAFEAHNAKVHIRLELLDPMRTFANENDISIIVLNMVQNAIHAMPHGGDLTITAKRQAKAMHVAFTDTGVGIEPEDLTRIFWPFWSRRADGKHGTGLGLSIVQATLKRLNGDIHVKSIRGSGTTFTIVLPDADATEPS